MAYSDLKTQIASYTHRDDLTDMIPTFVSFATSRIGRDLRTQEMEEQEDITIDSGSVALPSDYVEGRSVLVYSGANKINLRYRTPSQLAFEYGGIVSGLPRSFTISGNKLITGPAPDSSYSGVLYYYAKPAALSDDTDTNTVLTAFPQIYTYAAIFEAAIYLEDDALAQKFGVLYDTEIGKANEAAKKGQYIGPLEARPSSWR